MAAVKESAGGSAVDADRSLAARRVRMAIGLPEMVALLQDRKLSKEAPEMIAFAARCVQMAVAVKNGVNYTVKADASPVKILGELLGQVGLTLIGTRTRIDGKAVWIYRIDAEKLIDLNEIIETRYQKGINRPKQSDPHPSIKTLQRGVDHLQKTPKPERGEPWDESQTIPNDEADEFVFEVEWEEETIEA